MQYSRVVGLRLEGNLVLLCVCLSVFFFGGGAASFDALYWQAAIVYGK